MVKNSVTVMLDVEFAMCSFSSQKVSKSQYDSTHVHATHPSSATCRAFTIRNWRCAPAPLVFKDTVTVMHYVEFAMHLFPLQKNEQKPV